MPRGRRDTVVALVRLLALSSLPLSLTPRFPHSYLHGLALTSLPPPLREFVLVHKKILTWESAMIILTNERGVV